MKAVIVGLAVYSVIITIFYIRADLKKRKLHDLSVGLFAKQISDFCLISKLEEENYKLKQPRDERGRFKKRG